MLVVICHLVQAAGSPVPPGSLQQHLVSLGPFGVRIFLVLSGFLITHLLLAELEANGRIDAWAFYVRRTVRIFIPFYVLIAVVALLHARGILVLAAGDVFHAATYTMNYHPSRAWALGHSWSLAVEEQFYLLMPATLVLLGRARGATMALSCLWRARRCDLPMLPGCRH